MSRESDIDTVLNAVYNISPFTEHDPCYETFSYTCPFCGVVEDKDNCLMSEIKHIKKCPYLISKKLIGEWYSYFVHIFHVIPSSYSPYVNLYIMRIIVCKWMGYIELWKVAKKIMLRDYLWDWHGLEMARKSIYSMFCYEGYNRW
jgi:hypothetical protein